MECTKGEWKLQRYNKNKLYVVSDYSQIAIVLPTETRGVVETPEQQEANANLLVASKRMYAALKAIKTLPDFALPGKLYKQVCEAIAKAEGE